MNDERFLQGPSGLGLDEQRMSGFVDVVDPKGPLGLDLGRTDDERWCFLQGPSGLDLERAMDEERRTKRAFLILREPGCLRASELQSFRASKCNMNWFFKMNEMGLYL
ncbi:hypothetical protein ACFX16_021207 [Malus domestica]